MNNTFLPAFLAVAILCYSGFARGDDKGAPASKKKTAAKRLYAKGIPEAGFLTLKTENYSVPIDAESGWTIDRMFFQDHLFGLGNGHYGTVITPKDGKWWGTGHKEGGREVVHSLKLTVDGKTTPIEADGTVSGSKIELIKHSTIWKFKTKVTIIITDDHIYERTEMEALEDCETTTFYYFMHIFPITTTQWMAKLPNGEIETGPLKHAGNHQIQKNTRWVAQFDPSVKRGYLCYTPKVITGSKSASMIWDLDRYHKYYLRQNSGQKFKKGEKLDFSVVVKSVPNETGDWKATQNAAKALMKEFPPID